MAKTATKTTMSKEENKNLKGYIKELTEGFAVKMQEKDQRIKELEDGLKWCVDYFTGDFLPEDYLKMQQLLNKQ